MKLPSLEDVGRGLVARARPYAGPLFVSVVLGYLAIRKIYEDAGRPAMPLDDSFIHLQYAKRFAEGHPFTFAPGSGFSSGATSFLWPLLLAPFQLVGLHGIDAIWGCWILGTLLHAATAVETKRLVEPVAGKGAAWGAAAMCLLFGAFTWFAWSGMETIGLTWAMVRTARVAADWCEAQPHERTMRRALGVAAMASLCPLFRPEGGLMSIAAFAVLMWKGAELGETRLAALRARLPSLVPIAAVVLQPLVNVLATGHARSTTAMVKWAIGNPYYTGAKLTGVVGGNIKMLLDELLGGGPYTAIFVPEHTNYVLAAGMLAAIPVAVLSKKVPRVALGVLLALGTIIPCTFLTILWNRVRYIYPFATGWFFLVACLGAGLERLAVAYKKELRFVAALVTGLAAGALSTKLDWSVKDLANSARAIDQQQVKLGEWAHDALPKDATIGVSDTGAIAYMADRKTFDVVGLTTEGEARYWVAGPGSRYEHYEHLSADVRPTHFILYPQWMACPPVLGERMTEATVTDQSILGGATMVAYVARYDILGRASLPTSRTVQAMLLDEVDVSDLESEERHRYVLGDTMDTQNLVTTFWADDGTEVADGGRHERLFDRFVVDLPEGKPIRMIARLSAKEPIEVTVGVGGTGVTKLALEASSWEEVELVLPPAVTGPGKTVEIRAVGVRPDGYANTFGSLHYWFFEE
ncbi:MAG TPA: hypothetical protein VL400_10335 [Polyangiaceae bacterium]|nr:hypothetical protein [Polyangiaceae bacterium]